jgi:hypothetical protein
VACMSRIPSFPKIDLTSFDLNALRSIELPKFELPTFELPKFQVPETAKNAAYLTIGLAAALVQRVAKLAA